MPGRRPQKIKSKNSFNRTRGSEPTVERKPKKNVCEALEVESLCLVETLLFFINDYLVTENFLNNIYNVQKTRRLFVEFTSDFRLYFQASH